MDPTTALSAAKTYQSVWEWGGPAAVLLMILIVFGWLMMRFCQTWISKLGARIDQLEDRQATTLVTCVQENTESQRRMADACERLSDTNSDILSALRSRPCLIETGVHQRPTLPHH